MKLTIGFSPCPNDTFIFDALVNGKIDTQGLEFDPVLEDVQTLNEWAAEQRLDITKLSFPALFNEAEKYAVLNAGAALGKGVGPLLIAKKRMDIADIAECRIAIPGLNTTANFLLHYAFPQVKNIVPMLFSSVEDAVLDGEVDMGVIIHENRFTYQQKGLQKVCDLGEVWESREKLPIPLGCIAIKKTLPRNVQIKVDELIGESVAHALANSKILSPYVVAHAQEMQQDVMRKHIELYVNDFTIDLGTAGRQAIEKLYTIYRWEKGLYSSSQRLFIS